MTPHNKVMKNLFSLGKELRIKHVVDKNQVPLVQRTL